jgi:hypothetical protein
VYTTRQKTPTGHQLFFNCDLHTSPRQILPPAPPRQISHPKLRPGAPVAGRSLISFGSVARLHLNKPARQLSPPTPPNQISHPQLRPASPRAGRHNFGDNDGNTIDLPRARLVEKWASTDQLAVLQGWLKLKHTQTPSFFDRPRPGLV